MTMRVWTRAIGLIGLCLSVATCSTDVTGDPSADQAAQKKAGLVVGAHTLSGTVFGGVTALANVTVEALANGSTTVLASNVTNGAGHYALALDAGTYDLRVTPPAGSGFSQQTVQDVVVPDGDAQHDVILLNQANGLSGVVKGHGGEPVPDVGILVYLQDSGALIASLQTDAAGAYQLNLSDGTYRFYVHGGSSPSIPPDWYGYVYNVLVTGPTTFDVELPVAHLTGKVTDESGAAVAGALVRAASQYESSAGSIQYLSGQTSATTDALGRYDLMVFTGQVGVQITTPSQNDFEFGLTVAADESHDFRLEAGGGLSGVVRGAGGALLAEVVLYVFDVNTGVLLSRLRTDAGGAYHVNLADGPYRFYVSGNGPGEAPASWYGYLNDVGVTGATTYDVDLPVARVTGRVTDANGAAVAGASLSSFVNHDDPAPSSRYFFGHSAVTTDADGRYELLTFTGPNGLTVTPPAESGLPTKGEFPVAIEGDGPHDIRLEAGGGLTGIMRGHGGAPVPNAVIYIYDTVVGGQIGALETKADGSYQINLPDGPYRFYLSRGSSPPAPSSWYGYQYDVQVTGPTRFDLDLPVARVTGRVTDTNGAPVLGATVRGTTERNDIGPPSRYLHNDEAATTDGEGAYTLLIFTGSVAFQVTPPAQSGFDSTALSSVTVAGDLSQSIILQHPDTTPPVITSGPLVIHLSDTSVSINWTTNEASTSRVEYGLGAVTTTTVDQAALTTTHAVTLVNLTPSSDYTYRVSSTDGAGNGPTATGLLMFRTQDPPGDITAPVITTPPAVAFVSDTSAIVTWQTDEPASSVVNYGAGGSLGSVASGPAGVFTRAHSVTLTGLTPSTPYSARAASTDPDGNGPTTSGIFPFVTHATPDTAAPVIVAGPTIDDITDHTITISWTTDEPSTSGVSFNDGTAFDLVSDAAFVTHHTLTLSNLTPSTAYHVTVSSTDPAGNGPTLGGPVDATTQAMPDLVAPVLSLVAVSSSGTTATVTWTTDEPSSSSVPYGLISGAPDGVRADVALVTAHQIQLTGLVPGQTYFFSVSSIDASGNKAVSPEGVFVVGKPPGSACASAPECASGFCADGVCCLSACGGGDTTDCAACSTAAGGTQNGTCTPAGASHVCYVRQLGHICESVDETLACDGASLTCPPPTPWAPESCAIATGNALALNGWDVNDPQNTPFGAMGITFVGSYAGKVASKKATKGCPDKPGFDLLPSDSGTGTGYYWEVKADPPITCSPGQSNCIQMQVCVKYDPAWIVALGYPDVSAAEPSLQLLHGIAPAGGGDGCDPGSAGWMSNQTMPVDTVNKIVCTPASSLSPFGLFLPKRNTSPTVHVPGAMTVEATGPKGAVVQYTASATDTEDVSLTPSCKPVSGSTFPIGTTTVSCKVVDSGGLAGTASFPVTVRDTEGPAWTGVPTAPLVAYATSTAGAKVTYTTPKANDKVSGSCTVTCKPLSATTFAPGKTTVTCSATDKTNHTTSASFTVWVQYQAPTDGAFFLAPIRANGSSLFQVGRPVPVRFRLTGTSAGITNLQAKLVVTKTSSTVQGTALDTSDETVDDTNFQFTYFSPLKLYRYRWKTRDQTQGTFRLKADLGDLVVHEINVSLKAAR